MNNLLTIEFEKFFGRVNLSENQNSRIESAVKALSAYLIENMGLDLGRVFIQGSYSTNTTVKPIKVNDKLIDYDVDLVVLCANGADSPTLSLEKLEEIISINEIYKDKIEKDEVNIPCIRLRYADEDSAGFHIDILPVVETESSIIYIPRKEEWEESDPRSYTKWVINKGERYRRTLMMLKRWRDLHSVPIKSIVLQVLIANSLSHSLEDSINVQETLASLNSYLSDKLVVPEVINPVLQTEDLASRWDLNDFLKFKELVEDATKLATSAITEDRHDEAASLWQTIFGKSFVFKTDQDIPIEVTLSKLGDISHVEELEDVSVKYIPEDGVKVEIEATVTLKWDRPLFRKNKAPGQVSLPRITRKMKIGENLKTDAGIDYYAKVYGLRGRTYDVLWQVVNTGEAAAFAGCLRGTIFSQEKKTSKDKKPNRDKKHNYESTLYPGTHWVECFVVIGQVCIARSGKFYIYIE